MVCFLRRHHQFPLLQDDDSDEPLTFRSINSVSMAPIGRSFGFDGPRVDAQPRGEGVTNGENA